MASFQKTKTGWRVFVKRKGVSKTSTFKTKREAQDWAARMENLILTTNQQKRKYTYGEMIERYLREELGKKRNGKFERYFLPNLLNHKIAKSEIGEESIIAYRDERLKSVQGPTVKRELIAMSHICTVAMKEWKWIDSNPFFNISKPKDNLPRVRRVTKEEIEKLKQACAYEIPPVTGVQLSVHAFLFAIETAMRLGEILSLTWENVDFEKRIAFLPMTKNGTSRTVPLSGQAIELLKQLPQKSKQCFPVNKHASSYFRAVKNRANIENLHFHDSRHEAITRLSRKLDVLTLARVVGHKNIQQLMTYYNESAEDIAKRL